MLLVRRPKNRARFPEDARDISLLHSVQTGSGPSQCPIQRIPVAVSSVVNRPAREALYSPPPTDEAKSGCIPQYIFMIRSLTKTERLKARLQNGPVTT
jgi:hypothetical protein